MFKITDLGFSTEDEEFETEAEAIEFALHTLPSDDTAYGVLDADENRYVCIVFQGDVWRPG